MATFKIDDVEYDTDNLSPVQTRVVGLYQKALKDEGDALNNLEVARAARIGNWPQAERIGNRRRQ